MRLWTLPAALFLLLSFTALSWGNGGPRERPAGTVKLGAREVKLVVEVDDKAKDARLVIPKALVTDDRRRADAGWHLPTLMAGLALTAAFVSGGLWLVRRGPRRQTAAALVVSLLAFGVAALQANTPVREPKPEPKIEVLTLPAGVTLTGKLILEVTNTGDTVKLIVDRSIVLKDTRKK